MDYIKIDVLVAKLVSGIYQGMLSYFTHIDVKTSDIDNLAAETCAYMTIVHPDYSKLAARIVISNLHKHTDASMLVVATRLYTKIKDKRGRPAK